MGACVQSQVTIPFWNFKDRLKGCTYLWPVIFSHYNNLHCGQWTVMKMTGKHLQSVVNSVYFAANYRPLFQILEVNA